MPRLVTVALFLVCGTSPLFALSPHFDPATMMPTSEIERGMRGIAKSVFQGVTISEFNVEVITVLEKDRLGYATILVRVLDGPVVERKCGIIGGMSGSPVYINGRLIGAISSTWNFEQEPVGGVTCIDAMLQALDEPDRQAALSPYSQTTEVLRTAGGPVTLHGRRISQLQVLPASSHANPFADDSTLNMRRVASPLYCSGLSEPAMKAVRDVFAPLGVEPVAGPGSVTKIVKTDLVPGAALGVREMWGDFEIDTGGTVTYRNGDTILGFGHPYTNSGSTELALCTSWVHDFVPCINRTDKVMSTMEEMGTLNQDRPWSVRGQLGVHPRSTPVNMRIVDLARNRTREFHVDITRRREMAPQLAAIAAMSAISAAFNAGEEGTVRTKIHVKGDRGQEIAREDFVPSGGLPEAAGTQSIADACTLLTQNRFRPQNVESVDFEAELSDKPNVAALESIWTEETVAKAGKELTVHVRLRPQDGDSVEKIAKIAMPLELEKGRLRVGAASGNDAMRLRSRLNVLAPVFYDLDGVVREFQSLERGSQILVAAGAPSRGIMLSGTKLLRLPDAFVSVLESAQRTDLVSGGAEVSAVIDVPWAVVGMAQLTVATEDRDGKQGPLTPTPKKESDSAEEAASTLPSLPRGVPASLWWAATAFSAPQPASATSDRSPVVDAPKPPPPGEKPAPGTPPASPKASDTPAAAKDAGTKDKAEEKPEDKAEGAVGRKPSIWAQTSYSDFADADLHGLAARSDGAVHLSCDWQVLPRLREQYVWSLAADGDALWAGTLDGGCVYRIEGKQARLVCETGDLGVTALCPLKDGAVLAGTIPGGRILRVAADGKATELCRLPLPYVWDLISDGKDGFFAAGGPEAAVFHIAVGGAVEQVAALRHTHATRLLRRGDDLYIGTAGPGRLYKVGADRRLVAVFDASPNDITSLAAGEDGTVIVGAGPKGVVVAVKPNGDAVQLFAGSDPVMAVAYMGGKVYAGLGDGGKIVEITDRDTYALLRDDDLSQVTALCATGSRLAAASASPGTVVLGDLNAAFEGSLDSRVLDARSQSRWGRVDWHASLPATARLALRLRSGNSADPKDTSWGPWSAPVSDPGRDRADAAPGRFLQYRLEMAKQAGGASPVLDWLRIAYLPANQRPTIKDAKPKEGDAINGKFKVTWKAEDPDKDKLQVKLMLRPRGKLDFSVLTEGVAKSEYEWNTKSTPDGVYDMRLVVDDSLSCPGDAEQATLDIADVTVDNSPPEITLVTGPVEQAGGGFALTGFALDATCAIGNIAWKAEGEDVWHAARLDDGIYDWKYERFLIVTPPLKETVSSITIRARDAAGNVADHVAKIERPKKAAKP